jgi:4-amino-4-deoxy-L-arabinose transferase-like glycosyltransferase
VLVPWYAAGLASDALTHGDEAYWIAAGWHTASLLLDERDVFAPEWQIGATASVLDLHHPTETAATRNPKLGALLIGVSVRGLGAPPPPAWRRDYGFGHDPEWNRSRGLLPARATLLAGRLPVALASLLAALALFQILRAQMAPGLAFAGALLVATSPLVLLLCRRAMLDGPAWAFTIGAIACTIRACRTPARLAPVLGAGVLACAAASSKLNAGILLPILALAFLLEAVRRRSAAPLAHAAVAGTVSALLFLALNPTLYVAPVEGVVSMLRIGSELGSLGATFVGMGLPTVASRIDAAHELLLVENGVIGSRVPLPLDAPLLAFGTLLLAARARRRTAARVVLIWLVVAVVAVCVWPPVRWDRYFLPALAPIGVAECVALAAIATALARAAARAARRSVRATG